jgi:hypothetical protein
MPAIIINSVCERDLDFAFLQQLYASPRFLGWFLKSVGLSSNLRLTEVACSVTNSIGESDLEMSLESPDVRIRVLIENKIDAVLQHRQADRYKERCKQYVDAGGCDIAITVLLAPRRYIEAREMIGGFDCQLTYESALDWLERNDPDNSYSAYSIELLRKATDRAKVGWTFQPNSAATNLWVAYWRLHTEVAPELCMPRPGTRPPRGDVISFKPPELHQTKNVRLRHNLKGRSVHLLFEKWTPADLIAKVGTQLWPGMRIAPAGQSSRIEMEVPSIFQRAEFASVEDAVRESLAAALHLLEFYRKVVAGSAAIPQL